MCNSRQSGDHYQEKKLTWAFPKFREAICLFAFPPQKNAGKVENQKKSMIIHDGEAVLRCFFCVAGASIQANIQTQA
jgi:hypothetical protein